MNRSHIFAHTYQYLLYWYFKRLFSILLGINSYTFYSNIRPKNVSLFFLFSHTNQLLSIKFRKIYDLGWKQRLVCVRRAERFTFAVYLKQSRRQSWLFFYLKIAFLLRPCTIISLFEHMYNFFLQYIVLFIFV